MAYDQVFPTDSTSKMIEVMVRDSTTGMGKTGLAYGSVTHCFWREGASSGTNATCVDAALGTWTTKGWKEVDATNQKGVYQFGVPNAALAAGTGAVTINFQASGMIDKSVRILLSSPTRGLAGPTALPDAAAAASGGLIINGSNAGNVEVDALTITGALTSGSTVLGNTTAGTIAATSITLSGTLQAATITSTGATTFNSLVVTTTSTFTGAIVITDQTTSLSLGKYLKDILEDTAILPAVWVVPGVGTSTLTTSDVDARLAAIHLDHLFATAASIPAAAAGTFYDQLISDGSATYNRTTDSLQALRDRGDAAWVTAAGFSTHSAADVVTAIGTGTFLTAIPWNAAWDAEVQSECTDALNAYDPPTKAETDTAALTAWTTALTEAYPAYDATSITPAQALYAILQSVSDFAISGLNISVKNLAGTEAMKFTMDSATVPTLRSRAAP